MSLEKAKPQLMTDAIFFHNTGNAKHILLR